MISRLREVIMQKNCFLLDVVQNGLSCQTQRSLKHHNSQTVRARELIFLENVHPTPCVMCHMSHVTCHVSGAACQVSHVTSNCQTVRARELKFLESVPPPPPTHKCHMSRVTCHVTYVTCHMSCVSCHMYFFYKVVELAGGGSVINWA